MFIKPSKRELLFVLLVAFPICLINSFISVIRKVNLWESFFQEWMDVFLFNFLVTYPFALIFVSIARKIMGRL